MRCNPVSSQRRNFLFRSKSIVWGYLPLVHEMSNKLNITNITLWNLQQGNSRGRASSLTFVCILSQLFQKPVSSPGLLSSLFRVNPCLTCHNQGKETLNNSVQYQHGCGCGNTSSAIFVTCNCLFLRNCSLAWHQLPAHW